ncbi:MAG TPA: UbiA-like polyprenyltransferase, partial [Tepidisphaeraceae bacterium]|nr:UbiA-like polyprenyltransferase [Tepidisphaeraceae bacterium]
MAVPRERHENVRRDQQKNGDECVWHWIVLRDSIGQIDTARFKSDSTSPGFASGLSEFARDIKLSHSIFAMPYALLATMLAARHDQIDGRFPTILQVVLIIACMIFARSFAMGMNRLIDADLDKLNPRTARRSIPAGRASKNFVRLICCVCAIAFCMTTSVFGIVYQNWLPLILSIPALAFLGSYPYLKRYTRWVHFYLGAALGLAPICAWIAIAGSIDSTPILLGLGVLFWTAGFDILYATQDVESDQQTGVRSV